VRPPRERRRPTPRRRPLTARRLTLSACRLPTPVQAEAVPLILGGGDVMAAAETGSGKTAAFALPVLQLVHEALAAAAAAGAGAAAAAAPAAAAAAAARPACALNPEDRDAVVALAPGGLVAQARDEHLWGGARAGAGAAAGRVYWEAAPRDAGLCRVGWAAPRASLDLGTDKLSFGFGGTGKRSHARKFEDYGEPFGAGDVVGCLLDADAGEISFTKNGEPLGVAFTLPAALRGALLLPAVALKNAEVGVNFGGDAAAPLRHGPPPGYAALASAPAAAPAPRSSRAAGGGAPPPAAPRALVLEPARELAEQTLAALEALGVHLPPPRVRAALAVGGAGAAAAARALRGGADVLVGTPARLAELLDAGAFSPAAVRLLVLDEADALLAGGGREALLRLFRRLPKAGEGAHRLQVCMFSATLHSKEVAALAAAVCQDPLLVDLRGREAALMPPGVDHLVLRVDPRADAAWLQSAPAVETDGVHAADAPPSPRLASREAASEAAKRLKPRLLARLADALGAGQAAVFVRTNHDAALLERFFKELGGGEVAVAGAGDAGAPAAKRAKGASGAAAAADTAGAGGDEEAGAPASRYSCAVLAGGRPAAERRAALAAFKAGAARFLVATDVAARGLDVAGLPFVFNLTLPERPEDYVHRCGRAGRAGARGLAVSLVADVPEKVWRAAGGAKPWLAPCAAAARLQAEGGHAAWLDERALLAAIEARLGAAVPEMGGGLVLPAAVAARLAGGGLEGAAYGAPASGEAAAAAAAAAGRRGATAAAAAALAALEEAAQASFFALQARDWGARA
jgi:ATP-dependent RNA helicase DDX1